jgi:GAF domain-containing protein
VTYADLGAAAQQRFGWKLYTAMRYLPTGEVERVHTSNPEAYPLAGRKPRRDTPWSNQVLIQGQPYFANDESGIRAAFEDADKIIGLGLGAVINVPVKAGGRVVGTLNFLREPGGYREEHLELALEIASLAKPLFK